MHLILIPLFIVALLVGIYFRGDIWEGLDLSLPASINSGALKKMLGPPPAADSPMRQQFGDQ